MSFQFNVRARVIKINPMPLAQSSHEDTRFAQIEPSRYECFIRTQQQQKKRLRYILPEESTKD